MRERAGVVLCLLLAVPGALRAALAGQVLGVAPGDQAKYAGAEFRCFDGSGPPALPASAVNDEFCDCADGSDEPGTGACAGQEVTHFFCPNEGGTPRRLYASRVGDGICDCCDGSDEAALAARAARHGLPAAAAGCANICAEVGKKEKEAAVKRIEDLRRAVSRREEIKSAALADRRSFQAEMQKLQGDLPALEQALKDVEGAAEEERAAQKEREEAERKTREEEAKAKEQQSEEEKKAEEAAFKEAFGGGECRWRQTGGCSPAGVREPANDKPCSDVILPGASGFCDCDGDEKPGAKEPAFECTSTRAGTCVKACMQAAAGGAAPPSPDAAATAGGADEKPQVSEYAKWMDGASSALGEEEGKAKEEEQPQVSEYTKWMDGAAEAMKPAEAAEAEAAEAAAPAEADKPAAAEAAAGAAPAKKTAIEQEREAKQQVQANKDKVQELQNKLDALPDDKLAYASLMGKTLQKRVGEFNYKVTFFTSAMQDHTSLGRWSKWTGPHAGEFDYGTMCWGGPERKLNVKFECGLEEALLDAFEPSRCVYEASVSHPGACEPAELEELTKGTRVVGVREEL